MSKLSFGFILLPLIYLLGFIQRNNAQNTYKSLGVLMYIIGHFFNMFILSVVKYETKYETKSSLYCTEDSLTHILVPMLNPFTFYFFNSTLGYFTCSEFDVNKYQSWICFTQLVIGIGIFFFVIWLDERAFRKNFKAEDPQS